MINVMLPHQDSDVQITVDKIIKTDSLSLEDNMEPQSSNCELECTTSKHNIPEQREDLKLERNASLAELGIETLHVDISNSKLKEIPARIFILKILRELDVSDNDIETLPNEIGELVHLRDLNISGNKLETLPLSMKQLVNLRKINLSDNKLSGILPGFECLYNLEVLNLGGNNMDETPHYLFSSLSNITHLDLSHNNLFSFGNVQSPLCAAKLQYLNLSHNNLSTIPFWLYATCRSLIELDLSHNEDLIEPKENMHCLKIYNPYGGMFCTLKCLNLSDCNLVVNHSWDFLKKFARLKKLHLGNEVYEHTKLKNLIYDIPVVSLMSSALTELYMPAASLSYLPENISMLKFLKVLDLQRNELDWLPDSFCLLQSLEKCFLSQNNLVMLPNNFGLLKALTELTLSENCEILSLPETFNQLLNLAYLDLYDNQFDDIPDCVISLPALKGLDLENNFCQTESVSNLFRYGELRHAMRCRVQNGNARVIGVKQRPDPVEEYEPGGGYFRSSSSEVSENESFHDVIHERGENSSIDSKPEVEERPWSSVDAKKDDENWSIVLDDDEWVPPDITYTYKLCIEVIPPRPRVYRRVTYRRSDFPTEEDQFEDD